MIWRKETVILAALSVLISLNAFSQVTHSAELERSESEPYYKFIGTSKLPTELIIGANLAPISVGEYSVQIESYRTQRIGFNLAAGIAPEPTRGTYLNPDRLSFSDIGKGHFIRAGADYLFVKNNADKQYKRLLLEPFLGIRVVYSRVIEQQIQNGQSALSSIIIFEDFTSHNVGLALSAGTVVNITKAISLKTAIQIGRDIYSERLYDYGYTPGMGLDWKIIKTQLLATLRVRIARGQRTAEMTRRN